MVWDGFDMLTILYTTVYPLDSQNILEPLLQYVKWPLPRKNKNLVFTEDFKQKHRSTSVLMVHRKHRGYATLSQSPWPWIQMDIDVYHQLMAVTKGKKCYKYDLLSYSMLLPKDRSTFYDVF